MSDGGAVTEAPTVVNVTNATTNGTVISFEETMLAYGSLYGMAVFCIIIGSIRSVWFVKEAISKSEKIESSITLKEAKRFPFTASAVLFGLYLFFKYGDTVKGQIKAVFSGTNSSFVAAANANSLTNNATAIAGNLTGLAFVKAQVLRQIPELSKDNVMYVLLILICWEGCTALAHLLKPFFSAILKTLPISCQPRVNFPYHLSLTRSKKPTDEANAQDVSPKERRKSKDDEDSDEGEDCHTNQKEETLMEVKFDTHDLVALAVCSLVGLSHVFIQRHWITNNLIGIAFSIYGIEALHLSSFKAGCLLLCGLFVYDVFWVFATEVMTTVATGISAPILLQFPQDLLQNGMAAKKYAMLGLGDIVIPGIFVALLRRFDSRVLNEDKEEQKENRLTRYYFPATMAAYGLGLVLTIFVMHYFKAAQPALLYLVPLCVGVPSLLAMARGEFQQLLNYSEDHLVKKDDEEAKAKAE